MDKEKKRFFCDACECLNLRPAGQIDAILLNGYVTRCDHCGTLQTLTEANEKIISFTFCDHAYHTNNQPLPA